MERPFTRRGVSIVELFSVIGTIAILVMSISLVTQAVQNFKTQPAIHQNKPAVPDNKRDIGSLDLRNLNSSPSGRNVNIYRPPKLVKREDKEAWRKFLDDPRTREWSAEVRADWEYLKKRKELADNNGK